MSSLEMVDARHGYGLESRDGPPYRLLRTDDGGQTWRDVTPAHGTLPVEAFSVLGRDSVFASVTVSRAHELLAVERSDDGGRTWSGSVLHDPQGVIGPADFVDTRNGFVGFGEGVAAGSMAFSVWRTRDGGGHWILAARTPTGVGKPGQLSFGCDKNGLAFVDANTGWVTGECAGGPLYFYVTHDAGHTWRRQRLSGFSNCQSCSVAAPRFFNRTQGSVQVTAFARNGKLVRLYWTDDGGRTWTSRPALTAGELGTAVFADARHVWIPAGPATAHLNRLLVSDDAGASWGSMTLPFNADAYQFDFVSQRLGFAVRGWPPKRSLFETRDGGRHWTTIPTTIAR